jgi:fluoride exporter
MWVWIAVAVAGSGGAVARYALDYVITSRRRGVMPWGTLVVNVSGSLAYGVVVGLAMQVSMPEAMRVGILAGFLGAYTTFSTWMYETLRLIEEGAWGIAVMNALGSVFCGVCAAGVGLCMGMRV